MLNVDEVNVEVDPAYEAQVADELKFEDFLAKSWGKIEKKFGEQPWVQALYAQRVTDNQNRVSFQGRKYGVTEGQFRQVQHLYHGPRCHGYDLVIISEEEYLAKHF